MPILKEPSYLIFIVSNFLGTAHLFFKRQSFLFVISYLALNRDYIIFYGRFRVQDEWQYPSQLEVQLSLAVPNASL